MSQPINDITAAVREHLSLLTPDQVCELLQVKKDWLYDHVEKGRIKAVRLGTRQLRFRPADIEAYLDREPDPIPEPAPIVRRRRRVNPK